MSFTKYNSDGVSLRNRVQYTQLEDEIIRVEQSHKDEVNINNIVKRHGLDLIAKTAAMQQFTYDENPNNDFQEVMNAVLKAEKSFTNLPSGIRKRFDNNAAKFMDFIYNPENKDEMVELGLAERKTTPPVVQVEVINPQPAETPPEA